MVTAQNVAFSEVEDSSDWHGKPFPPDMAERAIAELGGVRSLVLRGPRPSPVLETHQATQPARAQRPRYAVGEKVAARTLAGAR